MVLIYTICQVAFTSGVPIITIRPIMLFPPITIPKVQNVAHVAWLVVVPGGTMCDIPAVLPEAVLRPTNSLAILDFAVR